MFIVHDYYLAVILCIVTMICWGSWANTQKLAGKTWRYELYYWDYAIGIFLLSIVMALTLGSFGEGGRGFFEDLSQADPAMLGSAAIGGVVFNAANILLSSSIALAGMAVAFPVGVGIALVLGVFINYIGKPQGDPLILFIGVALIVVAIVVNGIAAKKNKREDVNHSNVQKGLWTAIIAGVLMAFFYRFVARAMDLDNFVSPTEGMITPYTAFFLFSIGLVLSNVIFNTILMRKPIEGEPVSYKAYFKGRFKTHMVGVFGGAVWGLGTIFSYIAAGKAGAAISYALGQGAPMVAAVWGIFIWKEFAGSSKKVNLLLIVMFICFILGLATIIMAGGN